MMDIRRHNDPFDGVKQGTERERRPKGKWDEVTEPVPGQKRAGIDVKRRGVDG